MCIQGPSVIGLDGYPDKSLQSLPVKALPLLLVAPYLGLRFAKALPFIFWETGARMYYVPANYQYDEENTRFDNTVWTYGTDYTLAVIMLFGAIHTWKSGCKFTSLRLYSTVMLLCYVTSVTAGAIAHQHYLTVDSLNTGEFRILWTICVGTVTLAGGFIGAIGSEIGKALQGMNGRTATPIFPQIFWAYYGIFQTTVCIMGGISFKRPACDIFIAGTTQAVPTFYAVFMLMQCYWETETKSLRNRTVISMFYVNLQTKFTFAYRILFLIGFSLNSPLLPAYPILLSLNLSLGTVNTILHTNLCLAWGLQCLTLRKFCVSLRDSASDIFISKRRE